MKVLLFFYTVSLNVFYPPPTGPSLLPTSISEPTTSMCHPMTSRRRAIPTSCPKMSWRSSSAFQICEHRYVWGTHDIVVQTTPNPREYISTHSHIRARGPSGPYKSHKLFLKMLTMISVAPDRRLPVWHQPTWQPPGEGDPLYRHGATVGDTPDCPPAQPATRTWIP